MTESEYRNAVFLVECASDGLKLALRSDAAREELVKATKKLEAAKRTLSVLLDGATAEERRAMTIATNEQW